MIIVGLSILLHAYEKKYIYLKHTDQSKLIMVLISSDNNPTNFDQ